jgi:hypothetical protein
VLVKSWVAVGELATISRGASVLGARARTCAWPADAHQARPRPSSPSEQKIRFPVSRTGGAGLLKLQLLIPWKSSVPLLQASTQSRDQTPALVAFDGPQHLAVAVPVSSSYLPLASLARSLSRWARSRACIAARSLARRRAATGASRASRSGLRYARLTARPDAPLRPLSPSHLN